MEQTVESKNISIGILKEKLRYFLFVASGTLTSNVCLQCLSACVHVQCVVYAHVYDSCFHHSQTTHK